MTVLAPERSLRLDAAPGLVRGGRPADSLELVVAATWEQLEREGSAACPLCSGSLGRARDGAPGLCGGCGSSLS